MPLNRFFSNADLKSESKVTLDCAEHHHIAHVVRLQEGDEVEIVNGRGDLALGKILKINKKNVSIQILKFTHELDTKTPRILLGVPLMRASKLEWIVEKGVELGVDVFLFYSAVHSELDTLSPRHLERFYTLSVSALKQSGRLYLPSIECVSSLDCLLKKEALLLFGDPRAEKTIDRESLSTAPAILFVSGPERGFSLEEETLLNEKGQGILLNRYVLRAETAPVAAASILGTF